MKRKITFLIAALSAIIMITQPVKVVGQTKGELEINTTNFTALTSGSGYAPYNGDHTNFSPTITSNQVMIQSSKIQFQGSNGYLYNKDPMDGNITKITITDGSKLLIYVGGSANSETQSVTSGSSISGSYKYFKVKYSSSNAGTATKITVEYTTGPTISVSATSIANFSYVVGKGPSTPSKTFTVSGSNLTNNLVVTASSNYEICKTSGGTYTNSLEYTPSTGTVSTSTAYVRLKADLEAGNYNTEDDKITLTSTGATSKTIALSGMVKGLYSYDIDFEDEEDTYTDWTFSSVSSKANAITAYNGDYCGETSGDPASLTTVNKIKKPVSLTCHLSKSSGNTTTSTWKVQVSTDKSSWTDVESTDAKDMSKGVWKDFSADLSTYNDVYVRVYYSGSTAKRDIDDLSLSYLPVDNSNNLAGNVTIPSDKSVSIGTLVIPNDKTLKVSGTLNVTTSLTNNGDEDNLIIEDGGQLICSNSVPATVKKNISAATAKDVTNWYGISSSVHKAGQTYEEMGSVTNLLGGTYDMFYYKESESKWINQKANVSPYAAAYTNMESCRGYIYRNAANVVLSYAGETNVGEISQYTLSHTSSLTNGLKGVNLIGNPYPHKIYKSVAFATTSGTATDTLQTGYYVIGGDGSCTATADNVAIDVNQAVLVIATEYANGKTLKFKDRTKAPAGGGSKANNDNIKFMVSNSQYEDVAYALFDKGSGLDKINHRNADIPMVYIPQDDNNYAIAMMSDDTKSFNLNFKAMTTGKYTLSYKATGTYSYLHVIDRLTGEDVDMLLEGEYSFIASPIDSENRFIVRLEYSAGSEISESSIFAYQSGSDIIVNGEGELQIFDMMGRRVLTQYVSGVETINLQSHGVYIFKLNEKTQKIVVK